MCLELRWLLIAVAGAAGWLIFVLLRRRDPTLRGLIFVLGANLALPLFALATGTECGLLGGLALFVFSLTVIVPALLRLGELRAQAAGRAQLAARLCALRALLQPGGPAGRERELRAALAAARAGRTDEHLALLQARLAAARSRARAWALREQIVYLLLQDRRFPDVVALHEADPLPIETQPLTASGLVRAYCELGRLDRASEVLRRLEAGPTAHDPGAAAQLNLARLVFLAFAGQARAVADLLAAGSGFIPGLPESARAYWIGTAALYAGESQPAQEAFARARALALAQADQRVALLAEAGLRRAANAPTPAPAPAGVDRELVRAVIERTQRERTLPRPRARLRQAKVTLALVGANLALFVAAYLVSRDPDGWMRIRWGANFPPAVAAGEWWRLISSLFLHADPLHILCNAYVLLLLGRLVEQMYGARRYLALYVLSGIAGSLASAWVAKGLLSVGASGAIFGLLGGLIVALIVRRATLPPSWRRSLLANLLFLLVLQVAVEWKVEFIDHAAHLGGLVGGLVLGVVLVPGGLLGAGLRARIGVALGLALAVAALVYGAGGALTCSPTATARRLARVTVRLGEVTLEVPRYWRAGSRGLEDPLGADPVLSLTELIETPRVGHLVRTRAGPNGRVVTLHFYVPAEHLPIYLPVVAQATDSVRFVDP